MRFLYFFFVLPILHHCKSSHVNFRLGPMLINIFFLADKIIKSVNLHAVFLWKNLDVFSAWMPPSPCERNSTAAAACNIRFRKFQI